MENLYYGQKAICFSPSGNCFIELEKKVAQSRHPRSLFAHPDNTHLPFTTFCTFHPIIKSPDDNPFDDMNELISVRFDNYSNINTKTHKSYLLKYEITEDGETLFMPIEKEDDDIIGIITYDYAASPDNLSDDEIYEILLDMVDDWNDYINERQYCYITIKNTALEVIDTFVADIKENNDYAEDIIYAGETLNIDLRDVSYQPFYSSENKLFNEINFNPRRVARSIVGVDDVYNPDLNDEYDD